MVLGVLVVGLRQRILPVQHVVSHWPSALGRDTLWGVLVM